ncbi:hypothetical protein [Chamaesiphon sp.]|uniref:hypothetical protein n=1 Tax=Chamaesiphon sp. TaxID=2814140 RepID=UPI003593C925
MLLNKIPLLVLLSFLLSSLPARAGTVSLQRESVIANVSENTGQLLDWSATDRRIERIFFDNPERFRDSFVITTDGCTNNKCVNASLLNISARSGGRYPEGSLKVILNDRSGRKRVLTVNVVKVKQVDDSVMTFSPVAILSRPNYRSSVGGAAPMTEFYNGNRVFYPISERKSSNKFSSK